MPLSDFIVFLGTIGGIGAVISFLEERIAVYQGLTPRWKETVNIILSFGLPLAALIIKLYVPPETIQQLAPFWQAAVVGFTAWMGSQIAHGRDYRRN